LESIELNFGPQQIENIAMLEEIKSNRDPNESRIIIDYAFNATEEDQNKIEAVSRSAVIPTATINFNSQFAIPGADLLANRDNAIPETLVYRYVPKRMPSSQVGDSFLSSTSYEPEPEGVDIGEFVENNVLLGAL
jgi:hypothetical protein